jgi:hypothetical protein
MKNFIPSSFFVTTLTFFMVHPLSAGAQSQDLDSMQPAAPAIPVPTQETSTDAPKTESATPATSVAATPVVRSEISKALEDKLFVGTSIAFSSLDADGDDWQAGFNNHLFVAYMLPLTLGKFSVAGQFRYAPIDVSPRIDSNSYRGVVEGYHFGGIGFMPLQSTWTAVAEADLGYLVSSLYSSDDLEKKSSHEVSGVAIGLGGGADYLLASKIRVGPRVRLAFGAFTSYEISGAVSCYF